MATAFLGVFFLIARRIAATCAIPETVAANLLAAPLASLAQLTVESVSHLVRAVEAAAQLPSGLRADARDSLRFIDVILNVEHQADAAEREAMSACVAIASSDARSLVLSLELARALETVTDHLAHAAFSLRDRMLEELSA